MSPTASRSVASSYSHDRDPFSSYSKGSFASSGDDDADSPQSVPLNSSEQSPRNMGAYPSKNAMSFSRKPMKKLSSSAPKRSFDLDHQTVGSFLFLVLPMVSSCMETLSTLWYLYICFRYVVLLLLLFC